MINRRRNITKIQERFLSSYLNKSKDTLDEFLEGNNNERQIAEFDNLGWIEYSKHDNILWIHTAYLRPSKKTAKIWDRLRELGKESGCDRAHFTTRRNPKAFERLFKGKTIQYKLEVIL